MVAILLVVRGFSLAADKRQEGEAVISRASQLSNLESEGSAPFVLRISWTALTLASGPAQGKYVLLWASVDKWREEVTLANFAQVRVGGKDRVWTKRNIDLRPYAVGQISSLVDNLWKLAPMQDENIVKVFTRSENGFSLKCVDLQKENRGKRTLCFSSSGEIVSSDSTSSGSVYEYSDFSAFGGRSFPRKLRVTKRGIPLIGAEVDDLAGETSSSAELFLPPAGAVEKQACEHPTQPKLVSKVSPTYPMSARQQHHEGSVIIFAVIETDGSVQNTAVIQTAGTDLDEAALTAVKQWRYSPTTCGNTPISEETEITVNFTLQ